MADLSLIATGLSSIKTGYEIAKTIASLDSAIEKADLKAKILEVMDSLITAKAAIEDLRDEIRQKDQEIASLREDLRLKASVFRLKDAYYDIDKEGTVVGDPYCQTCFESTGKLYHLYETSSTSGVGHFFCHICENDFRLPSRRGC